MTAESPPAGRRCAVLGSPIAHSLSPALHRAAYAHLDLHDWTYDAYDVDAAGLADFVTTLGPEWRGLSLTMPLKTAVMDLGAVDASARQVGVGNTLILDPAGHRVFNTDVEGLVWALRRGGLTAPASATILGAGATARSALASLARIGVQRVHVHARRPAAAEELRPLAVELGLALTVRPWDEPVEPADALLSTVVRGAADERADEFATHADVVFDAVYDPWPTALAAAASGTQATVVNGLDLLVGQALVQIELMTGSAVPAEVLYTAGRTELALRDQPGRPEPA